MKPRKQISAGIIGKEAPNPYLRTVKSRGKTYEILTFPGDTSCYGVKHWEDYDLADLDPVFMKKLEESNGLPRNPNFDREAYRAKFARKPEELAVQDTDVLDNGAGVGSGSGSAAHNDSAPPAEGNPSAAADGSTAQNDVKSRGKTYKILTLPGDTSCYGVKHWEDYDLADLDPVFMKKLEETNGLPKNPNFDVEAYRAKFARKPEELAVQDTDVLDNGAGGSCSGSAAHNDSDPPAEGSPSAAAGGVLLHPLFGDSLKSMFKDFQLMGAEQREQTVKHAIEVFFTSLDPEAQKSEGKLTEKRTNESESANDICVDVVTDDMGFLQVEAKPVKNDGNFV